MFDKSYPSQRDYFRFRKEINANLTALITPHLTSTGYECFFDVLDEDEPPEVLMAWFTRSSEGMPTGQKFTLQGAIFLKEFEGFIEGGVLVDSTDGGLLTYGYDNLPLEDLYLLSTWAENHFCPACIA